MTVEIGARHCSGVSFFRQQSFCEIRVPSLTGTTSELERPFVEFAVSTQPLSSLFRYLVKRGERENVTMG